MKIQWNDQGKSYLARHERDAVNAGLTTGVVAAGHLSGSNDSPDIFLVTVDGAVRLVGHGVQDEDFEDESAEAMTDAQIHARLSALEAELRRQAKPGRTRPTPEPPPAPEAAETHHDEHSEPHE